MLKPRCFGLVLVCEILGGVRGHLDRVGTAECDGLAVEGIGVFLYSQVVLRVGVGV